MPKNLNPNSEESISIPTELVDFIASEKTSSQIADICLKNGVADEAKIESVSYRIAWIILGRLPKESLAMVLKNGEGLNAQTAEKISADANRLIFSQMPQTQSTVGAEETTAPAEKETKEAPPKSSAKDYYREPAE